MPDHFSVQLGAAGRHPFRVGDVQCPVVSQVQREQKLYGHPRHEHEHDDEEAGFGNPDVHGHLVDDERGGNDNRKR